MSDELTRDEIKRAVEAVPGWEWVEEGCQSWAAVGDEDETEWFLVTRHDGQDLIDYHDCDGIAVLEATGERWQCGRSIGKEGPYFALIPGHPHTFGPDLATAAVRAVNQWVERKETP